MHYNVNDRDNTYTVKRTADPVLADSGNLQLVAEFFLSLRSCCVRDSSRVRCLGCLFSFSEHFLLTADVLNLSREFEVSLFQDLTPRHWLIRSDLIFNCRKCPILLERSDDLRLRPPRCLETSGTITQWYDATTLKERNPYHLSCKKGFSCIPIVYRKQFCLSQRDIVTWNGSGRIVQSSASSEAALPSVFRTPCCTSSCSSSVW